MVALFPPSYTSVKYLILTFTFALLKMFASSNLPVAFPGLVRYIESPLTNCANPGLGWGSCILQKLRTAILIVKYSINQYAHCVASDAIFCDPLPSRAQFWVSRVLILGQCSLAIILDWSAPDWTCSTQFRLSRYH